MAERSTAASSQKASATVPPTVVSPWLTPDQRCSLAGQAGDAVALLVVVDAAIHFVVVGDTIVFLARTTRAYHFVPTTSCNGNKPPHVGLLQPSASRRTRNASPAKMTKIGALHQTGTANPVTTTSHPVNSRSK